MVRNSIKSKDLIGFLIGLIVLILINLISSKLFYRFDLTSEKRYSISDATKEILNSLEGELIVNVYLEGEFPAAFKRLRNETREMLSEFRAHSNGNIDFEFINPSDNPDRKERDQIYKNLYKKGLRPTDLEITDDDGISRKVVWPGAIMSYEERETAVQLLKSHFSASPQKVLNQSIESLEYELAFAIKKLITPLIHRIAFIEGHGELNKYETADVVGTLREFYDVERLRIDGNVNSLSRRIYINKDSTKAKIANYFDAIIIAEPDSAFSEKDKFIIDQYIMHGGKVIWLINQVEANMDSLNSKNNQTILALPKRLNLDDQLFRYGVRINSDLIQDLRAAYIPVVSGQFGNQIQTEFHPWIYFPLIYSKNDHPINKNTDAVKAEFPSSIELVGNKSLHRTVILSSSNSAKLVKAPTRVSLNMLSFKPPEKQFKNKDVPIAVMVEGEFESLFKNRLTPNITNAGEIQFKEKSDTTQQLFISDGSIIRNDFNQRTNEFFALGFDKYTKQVYGNKDFFLNAVNYMVDDSGLILTKNKSFKIRLLNTQLVDKNNLLIQIINTIMPVFVIILIGLLLFYLRKRKFTV